MIIKIAGLTIETMGFSLVWAGLSNGAGVQVELEAGRPWQPWSVLREPGCRNILWGPFRIILEGPLTAQQKADRVGALGRWVADHTSGVAAGSPTASTHALSAASSAPRQ